MNNFLQYFISKLKNNQYPDQNTSHSVILYLYLELLEFYQEDNNLVF